MAALEEAALDAGAIDFLDVVGFTVEGGADLLDDFQQVLGGDFAGSVFIGADGGFGDAEFAVVIPPGLDGAPSEAVGLAVFILEGDGADGLVTGDVGGALGVFEGSEDAHFEVI